MGQCSSMMCLLGWFVFGLRGWSVRWTNKSDTERGGSYYIQSVQHWHCWCWVLLVRFLYGLIFCKNGNREKKLRRTVLLLGVPLEVFFLLLLLPISCFSGVVFLFFSSPPKIGIALYALSSTDPRCRDFRWAPLQLVGGWSSQNGFPMVGLRKNTCQFSRRLKKRPFEKTWNVCDISKPRCCCFDDFSHWWVCFAVGPGSYAVFYWVNRVSLWFFKDWFI